MATLNPPGYPSRLGNRRCSCLYDWAVAMRHERRTVRWPATRLALAMIKPGADTATVRRELAGAYEAVAGVERRLTVADVRQLYPDAYGADYLARQDAYLTCGPVQVLVLIARRAGTDVTQVKAHIRGILGGGDPLRNHLHMPDSPGDTFCDIAHLAGPDVLYDLYERYDRDHAPRRLARYRAALAQR